MHKKEKFYIKLLTNVGNPDFAQDSHNGFGAISEIKMWVIKNYLCYVN